jgi:hypothetical protein
MTGHAYEDQLRQQLRAAEAELGIRRTCEALVLAILNGWGPAGPEAEQMRHEIREALTHQAVISSP